MTQPAHSTQLERQLRLFSGLVMVLFVTTHLINHSLGLISVDSMEWFRRSIHVPLWNNPLSKALLFASLTLHFFLALFSIYRRSSLRMPAWELAQIAFGFSIPLMLAGHIVAAQIGPELGEYTMSYTLAMDMIWSNSWARIKQPLLVIIVWTHAMIGLHFWLRLRTGYRKWLPVYYAAAVMLPVLAILGFVRAALEMQGRLATDPLLKVSLYADVLAAGEQQQAFIQQVAELSPWLMLVFIVLALLARWLRLWRAQHDAGFTVHHPLAGALQGRVGQSVLEVLRNAGVPHASICGGRARCTTCRINIDRGLQGLPVAEDMEAAALQRIHATESVRLACQVRPQHDIWITPLLSARIGPDDYQGTGGISGNEQEVVAMFVDLRGFTRFSEERLPYDVVLILNQFFGHMSAALASTRGHYAQFTGDGLFALFGLQGGIQQACRDALSSAVEMQCRLGKLNQAVSDELSDPLRIGIGIHCGEAIVGPMGPPEARVVSAIGDSVNVASRLEAASKQFSCVVVVSAETVERAGLTMPHVAQENIEIRGRQQRLAVYPVSDVGDIQQALDAAKS